MNRSDLSYVFDRLDRQHVGDLARTVRAAWEGGAEAFEVCYMPGDGTHYGLVFTVVGINLPVLGAEGGGSNGMGPSSALGVGPASRLAAQYAIVTYVQAGTAMVVHRDSFVDPGDVAAKLGPGPASSLAIAVLLNAITDGAPGWEQRMIENAPADGVRA